MMAPNRMIMAETVIIASVGLRHALISCRIFQPPCGVSTAAHPTPRLASFVLLDELTEHIEKHVTLTVAALNDSRMEHVDDGAELFLEGHQLTTGCGDRDASRWFHHWDPTDDRGPGTR